jgi:hypothetical protein
MTGRKLLFIIIVSMSVLIGLSFRFYGYLPTWKLWNIPATLPPFTDLRLLPGSAESFRQGFDPVKQNPGDPLGRHFNYPRAWYLVFYTGIKQSDTIWLGILLAFGFLFSVWMFPRRLDLTSAGFLALILFSPASMLALERGNVDLFIFILCALALLALENRVWLSAGFFMLATLLKLFPIFAFVAFLQRGKKHFFIISIAASAILLIYAALTYSNIVASYAFTEKGGDLSYGVTVLPLYLHPFLAAPNIYGIFILGSYFAAFGLFGSAVFYGIRSKLLPVADVHHLAAFRLGAAIYVGTFFLGNNWDYRLIFLLFTIPQLVSWGAASRAARWILAMLILSCWYLITLKIFGGLPFGHELVYAVDQICKWGLFAGLIHLFFRVRPWFAEVNEIRRAVSEDADTLTRIAVADAVGFYEKMGMRQTGERIYRGWLLPLLQKKL